MTGFLCLSSRIYGGILLLYPEDLRRDFGADMASVFAEDLAEAWTTRGIRGAWRVWSGTLSEVIRIALPRQLEKPAIAVPVASFAFCAISFGFELLAFRAAPGGARPRIPATFSEALIAAALPSASCAAAAAVVAFVAVRRWELTAPVSLGLTGRT